MSHSVYLYYKNKNLEDESFQFTVQIPFLWQEMYDLELIENQENKILEGLSRNQNNADAHLIIPVEKAVRNLEIKSKLFTSEKDDKKQLRIDFLNFINENVDKTSDFEIIFFELKDLYLSMEDLVNDVKSFHTDRKKELRYQREPVSFRAIGYNENFKSHSKIYQSLLEEEEKKQFNQLGKTSKSNEKKDFSSNENRCFRKRIFIFNYHRFNFNWASIDVHQIRLHFRCTFYNHRDFGLHFQSNQN